MASGSDVSGSVDATGPASQSESKHHRWTQAELAAHVSRHIAWRTSGKGGQSPFHLRHADLRGLTIVGAECVGMDFRGADLRGAMLSAPPFVDCDFSYTRLERANMYTGSGMVFGECRLVGASGLFGDERAAFHKGATHPTRPCVFQRWGHGRWWGDAPNWRHLAFVGGLPIFGVSNVALFGILAYAGAVEWYNRQLSRVTTRLPESADGARDMLAHLGPLPAPPHLANLLIVLLGLLAASMVYRLRCPDVVKEFSRAGWERQGGELLEYLSALYARPVERWVCGVLYLAFGGWAAVYLLRRIMAAVVFLFAG